MLWAYILVTCTAFAQAFRHSVPVKYKKPAGIDISEITFTTPSGDVDYHPSINHLNYYNGKNNNNNNINNSKRVSKAGLVTKNEIFSPDTNRAPILFTPIENDSPFNSKYYESNIKPDIYKSAKKLAPVEKYKVPDVSNIFKPAVKVPYGKNEGIVQASGNNFRPSPLIESTTATAFRNNDYGTVVGAPPDILKQYSTKVPLSPHQEFSSSNGYLQPQKHKGFSVNGKYLQAQAQSEFSPSGGYRQPQKQVEFTTGSGFLQPQKQVEFTTGSGFLQAQKQSFVPISTSGSSSFFNSDLPSITADDYKKFEKITEGPSLTPEYNKKDLYSKKANKKPVYPKKFTSSNLKKLNPKIKAKPVEEINEHLIESEKLKKNVPNSFYKEPVQSNTFSSGLSSFYEPTGGADIGLGHFAEPAPIRANSEFSWFTDSAPIRGGGGERVEFQMYGMDGPHSYKFGYDTGKGHNRHFRFEERDSNGKVKGHYGYMDKEGKMRVMKYEADPHTGFHAGPMDYPPNDFNY